MISIDFLNIC